MDANGVLIHKTALSKTDVYNQVLKEGSSIFVRVIKDNHNGTYQGSVAGIKVNIHSHNELKPGTSFKATLSIKNGTILLQPEIKDVFIDKSFKINQIFEQISETPFSLISNQYLSSQLESLLLVPDNLSLHILMQFKQIGLKFEPSVMRKIYLLSKKIKGKEKRAAEILTLMFQKSIEPTEEELIKILSDDFDLSEKNPIQLEEKNTTDVLSELSKFIQSVFNCELQNEFGILTLYNHAVSQKFENKNWIIIPYEILEKQSTQGKGQIKLLFYDKTKLSKVHLSCKYKNNEYIFLLEIENKTISSIKFYKSNVNLKKIQSEIEKLKKFLNTNVHIEWVNKNYLEGTSCGTEKLFMMNGEV